jgi:hypothetical protein
MKVHKMLLDVLPHGSLFKLILQVRAGVEADSEQCY